MSTKQTYQLTMEVTVEAPAGGEFAPSFSEAEQAVMLAVAIGKGMMKDGPSPAVILDIQPV